MTNESPYINNSLIGSSDDEIFYLNSIRKGLLDECNYADPEELCAMDIAIEAVKSKSSAEEYRTPKTPTYKMVYGKRLLTEAYCPECGNTVFRDYGYCSECGNTVFRSDDYCSKCGQAIDWSEVENDKRR